MTGRHRVRLYPSCVPGYQLPFFAADVFARHGLDLEILDPLPPPWTANSVRVATGEADFAVTSVTCFLLARSAARREFPARFVAVLHQRSPLGAVVAEDSGVAEPADLAGQRLGRTHSAGWMADEARHVVADHGMGPPVVVPVDPGQGPAALDRGDIDMMPAYLDALRGAASPGDGVRTVPLGGDTYASGLIANDRIPGDVVVRMRHALTDAFEAQRDDPDARVDDLCERFPGVHPHRARAVWEHLVPYVFTGRPVGGMSHRRWADTLSWARRVHGLGQLDPADVYRPELEGAGGWIPSAR
ncbi:MAG TPA: ABC transporter substrate-binding protein [Acidimicrobiales bacterium]|nr:ABC transporter substrate-binding protein [Acidimicrobiales bacterium]